jgi:hypothetical protein
MKHHGTSFFRLAILSIGVLLAGCQSEVVPSTGAHPPTDPQTVKIYQSAPQKYEKLGVIMIPVGGDVKWDEKGDANLGFRMFREKAAAQGANGVLLAVDPGMSDAKVTAGDSGKYYSVPFQATSKQAVAQAIFVIKD